MSLDHENRGTSTNEWTIAWQRLGVGQVVEMVNPVIAARVGQPRSG